VFRLLRLGKCTHRYSVSDAELDKRARFCSVAESEYRSTFGRPCRPIPYRLKEISYFEVSNRRGHRTWPK
jgi:hypothetical protein